MSRDKLKLGLSRGSFHDLALALDKVRSTSTTVKVDKAALNALLTDHSKLLGRLHEAGVETHEDE